MGLPSITPFLAARARLSPGAAGTDGDHPLLRAAPTEAAEWAQKAQICFNECVRSLTPHWELLKQDELQDCEDIKQTGLLQAVQLYNLMYGGKVLQMGITRAYLTQTLHIPLFLPPFLLPCPYSPVLCPMLRHAPSPFSCLRPFS